MGLSAGKIHVVVNGTPVLEYDRSKPVPGQQRRYLDNMDIRMDQGIELNGGLIANPDPNQRSQFVANSMINALFTENYSLAIAMCTWLAERIPELKQVQAAGDIEQEMRVDLIFDRDYQTSKTEQPIKFFNTNKSNT
ncbi:MAG: hypothetical protein R3F02_06980 [Thiolinea sp.]